MLDKPETDELDRLDRFAAGGDAPATDATEADAPSDAGQRPDLLRHRRFISRRSRLRRPHSQGGRRPTRRLTRTIQRSGPRYACVRTFRRPVWCGRRSRCPQGGHACGGGGAADQLLRSDHRTRQPDRRRARRRACAARPGADHRSGWRSYAEILRDLDARIRLPPDYGAHEKRRDIELSPWCPTLGLAIDNPLASRPARHARSLELPADGKFRMLDKPKRHWRRSGRRAPASLGHRPWPCDRRPAQRPAGTKRIGSWIWAQATQTMSTSASCCRAAARSGAATTRWTRGKRPRAIALDMESGTIAANGYRLRVPYGSAPFRRPGSCRRSGSLAGRWRSLIGRVVDLSVLIAVMSSPPSLRP